MTKDELYVFYKQANSAGVSRKNKRLFMELWEQLQYGYRNQVTGVVMSEQEFNAYQETAQRNDIAFMITPYTSCS